MVICLGISKYVSLHNSGNNLLKLANYMQLNAGTSPFVRCSFNIYLFKKVFFHMRKGYEHFLLAEQNVSFFQILILHYTS